MSVPGLVLAFEMCFGLISTADHSRSHISGYLPTSEYRSCSIFLTDRDVMTLICGKVPAFLITSLAVALLAMSGCRSLGPEPQSQPKTTAQNSQPSLRNSQPVPEPESSAPKTCSPMEIHYSPEENLEQI